MDSECDKILVKMVARYGVENYRLENRVKQLESENKALRAEVLEVRAELSTQKSQA